MFKKKKKIEHKKKYLFYFLRLSPQSSNSFYESKKSFSNSIWASITVISQGLRNMYDINYLLRIRED